MDRQLGVGAPGVGNNVIGEATAEAKGTCKEDIWGDRAVKQGMSKRGLNQFRTLDVESVCVCGGRAFKSQVGTVRGAAFENV